jgi:hypothetical protein
MQKGYIYQTNGAWHIRYRVDGKQVSRRLVHYNDQYRTKRSVRPLADEDLDPLNQGLQVNGLLPVTLARRGRWLGHAIDHQLRNVITAAAKAFRVLHGAGRIFPEINCLANRIGFEVSPKLWSVCLM